MSVRTRRRPTVSAVARSIPAAANSWAAKASSRWGSNVGMASRPASLRLQALVADDAAVARAVGIDQGLQLGRRARLRDGALCDQLLAHLGVRYHRLHVARELVDDRSGRAGRREQRDP